jgi:hypothetical protein
MSAKLFNADLKEPISSHCTAKHRRTADYAALKHRIDYSRHVEMAAENETAREKA